MEYLLQVLWAPTTTVNQVLSMVHIPIHGSLLGSTLTTHCGMDKIVVDVSIPAVIPQISRGSAINFLSRLLMTWRFASVQIKLIWMRALPLTLFSSTFSESDNVMCHYELEKSMVASISPHHFILRLYCLVIA